MVGSSNPPRGFADYVQDALSQLQSYDEEVQGLLKAWSRD